MKKKKVISISMMLIMSLISTLGYSQTTDEKYKKSLEYLQGTGIYEEGMMVFLSNLKNSIWSHFDLFINDAKALAAIFMIIFFAIKSYEMMAGDKKLEIMPLLRPFGLVMVILWWGAFVKVIAYPAKLVSMQTEEMFNSEQKNVNKLRFERADYMLKVANAMYSFQAETEVAHKESDSWYEKAWDTVNSSVMEKISSVVMPIVELKNRLSVGLQLFMTQLLELLAIWLLRIAVYIVFIIQIIYSSILVILGPFAVAASILPAFRDSFSTWIARFVSVSLYTGIAYLIMYIMALMQKFALSSEISKYKELIDLDAGRLQKIAWFASNGVLSFGTVIVTFVIGAICMFTVPSISTWIISTSGISSAASNFGRGAGTVKGLAKSAIKKF
ncbi:plasmid transfer protein [Pedobacter sp. MC2016-24]|uniref:plasmid transfer protein n=1 Tax=Pedobacter sp. MC2016-24 TaxID=2780090 RepID=UPI0018828320|nr:plasmid transfer protein [Pedobacter sp. MC2016-24]MBE9599900.1 plasmid transfer protein [Pedobacter sp. MC2016-24]